MHSSDGIRNHRTRLDVAGIACRVGLAVIAYGPVAIPTYEQLGKLVFRPFLAVRCSLPRL